MRKFDTLSASFSLTNRTTGYLRLPMLVLVMLIVGINVTHAQLTGTKTIPGTYATIALAITDLNTQGVGAGGVTFNVATGYTETLTGRLDITATGTAANPIIFQKSGGGANPVITSYTGTATATSAAMDGMIALIGSDYVTFDGINLQEAAGNTDATTTMEYGYGLFKASATDGANNNSIKNCTITLNRVNNTAATSGPAFQGSNGITLLACTQLAMQTTITVTAASGASSNNTFYANTIQNVNTGICMSGFAGVSPFTLCDTGNDIGGSSALTGNTIINFGGGTGATNACAAVFIKDQWSFNVSYNTVNNNNGSGVNHVQTNRGIFANASSIGASATINNNNVTITGGTSTTAIDWAIDCEMAQSGAAGNTISISNNTLSMTKTATTSVALTAIWVQSAPTTMNINGNTITNFTCSSTSTSTTDVGVIRSGLAGIGTLNINNNNISGVTFTGASGTGFCIGNSGSVVTAVNITGNVINGINFTVANSRILNVITNTGAANTATTTISNNNIQGITYTGAGSGSNTYIIGTGTPLNETISGNTFTNLNVNTTGSVTFIAHSYSIPAGGSQTISNNSIVGAFNKGGAGGTVTCTTSGASSPNGTTASTINNNFSNITVTGATTIQGTLSNDGSGTSPSKTFTGNTYSNWTGGTSAITCVTYNYLGSPTSSISNNTFTNITGQGAITVVSIGNTFAGANPLNISNNTINNITSTGTGGAVTGITCTNASAIVNVNGNTINTLSSTGASAVNGISIGGATNTSVFKNKIYDLSGSNASSTVNGILISAGTLVNAHNNLIGDLRTPIANAANPLNGINVTGSTTTNLYFNTVYLNATSSGALFGSSAVNASTTPTLTLRNNVLVNLSTPGATGFTAAYRRSTTTLTSYAAASNNNLFYAGTPSTTNLIFYDGTNSDQTLAAFKARVAPRDVVSVTENPSFLSTTGSSANFLHIDPSVATQIESGATNISGITDDYDGQTRSVSTPDMGADEGNFLLLDILPPTITYTLIPATCSAGDIPLNGVAITDASGVPTTGVLVPRIYYKKNAGAWFSQPGTLATGTGTNGTWNFSIVVADMGGIVAGDVVSYYVIAQDIATPINIASNPSGAVATDVNTVTTPPATPNTTTFVTPLAGTYTVGPTGTYASVTAAVSAVLLNGLTAPVIFELQSTYTSAGETFPIVLGTTNACGGGLTATNTVTIRPQSGATNLSINGTNAGPTFDINAGNWWRIDGRPGGVGVDKELSITNNNVLGQAIQFINEGSNDIVRYCKIQGVNTSATSGTIVIGTTTGANGNDNNLIENCDIFDGATTPTNAIWSLGTTTTVATYNDNNTISNCNIYNFFSATVNSTGIKADAGNSAWSITGNSFYQTVSPRTITAAVTHRPMWLTPNTGNLTPQASGFVVTGNFIGGSSANAGGAAYNITGTAAALFFGMDISVGNGTATSIQNNTIQNIAFTTTSSSAPAFVGISVVNGNVNVGTTSGNTIGSGTGTGSITITNTISSAATAQGIRMNGGTSTVLNCQNNTIGGFRIIGSATIQSGFVGIISSGGTTTNVTINNNTIGSASTANSINLSTASTGTGSATGIAVTGGATTLTINGNTIANLNNNSTATLTAQVRGIQVTTGTPIITNNTIRNLSSSVAYTGTGYAILGIDQSSSAGAANVSGNILHSFSLTSTSVTAQMQCTGIQSSSSIAGSVFAKNIIHSFDVTAANPACFMTGFDVSGGTATFVNNMIRLGIRPDGTDMTAPMTVRGISINSSSANNFYFNSIYIGGANVGTTATNTFAFNRSINSGTHDVRNNIFVNNRSNATTGGKHYAVKLTTGAVGFNPNYNDYQYTGTGGIFANNGVADVPAYTSGWVTSDVNSIVGNPQFIAPTGNSATVDLHIHPTNPTVIEGAGIAIVSITDDYDSQTRASFTPTDMGADAGNFVVNDISAPVIAYTALLSGCGTGDIALNGVTISDASGVPTTGTLRPRVYYRKNAGTWFSQPGTIATGTGTNGTWNFTMVAADMGGLALADVVQYYVIAQDLAGTPNISSNPAGAVATDVNTVTTPPTTPNSITIIGTLSGTFTVGSGGTYPTLTAAVAAYNSSCITGAVVFNLTDATYTGETFPITINAVAGASAVNTLTIKPSTGVTASISGSSATAMIVLNGADFVTINGSNGNTANTICPASAASRDLTITNTNTSTSSAVVWLQSAGTNGATNNSVINCNLIGSGNTQTLIGLGAGSATISITSTGSGNNNNAFINNNISKTQYALYSQGASTAVKNTGNIINQNLVNTAAPNNVRRAGVYVGFEDNITISGNIISNIESATTIEDVFGITFGSNAISTSTFTGNEVTNALVSNNVIGSVRQTVTYSAAGIYVASATSGTNKIYNNMISGVSANATSGDYTVGILIGGGAGSTTQVYNNTVSMSGSQTGSTDKSYALAIAGTDPVVDVRNNILVNSQNNGSGNNYAVGYGYSTFANLTSNNNDYFVSTGATFFIGGTGSISAPTNQATLANLQAATGKDAASKNINPTFVSSTDLHLTAVAANGPLACSAAPLAAIPADIDCATRSLTNPTIGADELASPLAVTLATVENSGTSNDGTICAGASADINSTVTGGSTPAYIWSTTATTANLTGLTPALTTTYTVTVTADACVATASATITVNPTPNASINVAETSGTTNNDGIICAGITASLTGIGGTSYAWNTGDNTAMINVTPAGTTTYTVTVTGAGGCTATATTTITVNPAPTASITVAEISGTANNDGIICAGASAALTGTGGTSYAWSTSDNTATISVTPAGTTTYTVTVTNANGCTATSTTTITVNPLPTPGITVAETSGTTNNDGIICTGASASLTGTGGASYAWNTGDNTAAISVTPAGTTTYTVTVTNANGCTATSTTTITVNPLPTPGITVAETSGTTNNDGIICAGATASLTGTGGTSYAWNTGDNTAAISVTPAGTITYTVTVTNANGCTATSTTTITVNPLPSPGITVAETSGTTNNDGIICAGASASLTGTGGTSYAWSTGDNTAAISVTPASTTTYTVTVTNANNCTATATTTITVNPLPTPGTTVVETSGAISNDGTICAGASATITGTGATSYAWNTGENTASITVTPASTTTYTVTVTNANGCTASSTRTITVIPLPGLSIMMQVEPTTCVSTDGSIDLTVNPAGTHTYSWSNGAATEDISGIAVGTYTVTVTNTTTGCTATTSVTLNGPGGCALCPTIASVTAAPSPVCVGKTVTLTASGLTNMGITYGIAFVSFPMATGTPYTGGTVLATVANGSLTSGGTEATATVTFPTSGTNFIYAILSPVPSDPICRPSNTTTLIVNPLPTPGITVAETSGTINNDGVICTGASASLTGTGGTSYAWSTGDNIATISVTPAGTTTYTVTVTNANGCTATSTTTITVNPLPTPGITIAETSGTTNNDGIICVGASASLTGTGGTSYAWSTGDNTAATNVTPASTTTYTVTVTNANGCTATSTTTITVNPLPTPGITVSETSGTINNDGVICAGATASLTGTGGTAYAWSTGDNTAAINVTPASTTTYTVTVTNANNCSSTATTTITVNPLPTPAIVVTETSGTTNNDGIICTGATATLTASGGTSYAWSNGINTAANPVTPASTTTYTVTVTNANNCSSTATTTITVNPLPTPGITVAETSGTTNNDGVICTGATATLTASGGTSYAWSNGINTAANTVTPASTTTYTVTVTNANGCTATSSSTITVNPLPTPATTVAETSGTVSNDGIICAGASATITATGGGTYAWSTGVNTAAITVAPGSTTTYTVTVTSAAGCTATSIRTITVNPLPTPAIAVTETSGATPNDAIICNGASATLTASGGTSYAWTTGATSAAILVAPAATTTYTVTVTNANGCTATSSATITVAPPSTLFTVTGGGGFCQGSSTVPVGLSGSQTGFNYQLQINAVNNGAPVAGTGAALNFGNFNTVGTYTVIAINVATTCTTPMSGSVTVFSFNCTPTISDPCVCLNNATTLTNGQFGEQIKVNAPSNQTWTVSAVTGLYTVSSPAPPAAPIAITVGTVLTNIGGNMFTLDGRHIDAIGYTISVTNGAGTTLSIGNSCQYPNPAITSDLTGPFCLYSAPVTLTGNPGDGSVTSQTFTVNGTTTTTFDPGAGVGQYTIVYTVNGGTPKAAGPNDPGCTQSVSQIVSVIATPASVSCNDLVYVSLDVDCVTEILPDDILEGTYGCDDDYIVELDKTAPYGNGPWVPATVGISDVGQTYQVRITHLVSGNKCWGNVKIEDKLEPVIECTDIDLSCPITTYDPAYLLNVLGIADAYPDVTECSAYTLSYVDTWHDLACNQGFNGVSDLSAYVARKWTAKDAWNNTSTCIQYIYFHRVHVGDVDFPADYIINCDGNINIDPSVTGTPYYTDFGINWKLFPDPGFCELQSAYTDQILPVCDGSYKILRTWTLVDWCLPTTPFPPSQNPQYYIQLIKVLDSQGPAMVCPANLTVSTDPYNCCATTNLPDVIIEDNCSRVNNIGAMVTTFDPYTGDQTGMYTVDGALMTFPGNNYWDLDTLGNWGWTPCLPVGRQTVVYTAEDDCGNTATCSFRLTVADWQPPVAACDQYTVVAIGTDDVSDCYTPADGCDGAGVTWIHAKTFDDGSTDNCNGLHFTIRRMDPYSDCINGLEDCEKPTATEEQDSIKFYCCEVGTTQTVILRVYQVDQDGAIMNGPDGTPLYNECMVNVEVQDKIKPVCQPPANVTVACENFDASLWVYGKATVYDNCCLDTTKVYQEQCGLTHSANYSLFDTVCSKGTITRTFRAYDCHGLTSQCTQRVVVQYNQDYYVRFPNDVIVTVCDGTGNYGEPSFFGEDCELLGVSYEDQVFTVVPDACFKIERVWTIINWCTYNPNLPCIEVPNPNPNAISNNPANLPGPIVSRAGTLAPWAPTVVKINPTDATATNYSTFWQKEANCYKYKQIIKVIDTQDPVVENCPASPVEVCDITPNDPLLWNESYWWDNLIGQHDLCEGPTDLTITATDACSAANINFRYLLFLDLDNDGTMETVINSVNTGIAGLGWNAVPFGNGANANYTGGTLRAFDGRPVPFNQKYGFAIQTTTSGTKKTASVRWNTQQSQSNFVIPELPYGTHKIKWFVEDGCGNESVCEYTFIVKDCKKPTVVCLNGLSVNIMPTQMIQLWASDFLKYTEDNCTPANQLKIAIRKSGTGTGFPVDGNGNPITNVTFTCDELGTQLVELWSIDKAGNADFCETYVIVQDNNSNCPNVNAAKVAGALATEGVDGVEEGAVEITGSSNAVPSFTFTTMSDNTGAYNFNAIPLASNSTVTPAKDDNPLNGVSTYDLVLISKHILGIEALNTPFKMIAADANKSNSITTFDIVELRKLILGIYSELPTNTSWRFVDKSFNFPNTANPFQTQFAESKAIQNLAVDQVNEDFVSVKVGDVNGTAIANSLMSADDRSVGTLLLDVTSPTPTLPGGEGDGVASGISGMGAGAVHVGQTFTVNLTPDQLVAGYQFTLNMNGLEVVDVTGLKGENYAVFADAVTFSVDGPAAQGVVSLTLKATKSGKISEMMSISSRVTKAEAYPAYAKASAGKGALDVALRFNVGSASTISGVGFELYQNQPNPFVNKTFVGFHLPEATTATLSIYDETGRTVFTQNGNFAKGYNTITIDRALLNTTGMLYYKLETATDSATKKMIQSK